MPGQRLGGVRSGQGEGEIRAEDLARDQFADIILGLAPGDPFPDERLRELLGARSFGRSLQRLAELVGILRGHEVMSAFLSVESRLDIVDASGGAVEARVRAEAERVSQRNVLSEGFDELEEIIHIESAVPLIFLASLENEPGLVSDRPDGAAGKQAERRRPAHHA